jgi:hypothetical protein
VFLRVGRDWVYLVLRPLLGLLYQPRMIDDQCRADGGMRIGKRTRSNRRKPAPLPRCPPQIPHNLNWARTRAAELGSRRLTAWAMTWPIVYLYWVYISILWMRTIRCSETSGSLRTTRRYDTEDRHRCENLRLKSSNILQPERNELCASLSAQVYGEQTLNCVLCFTRLWTLVKWLLKMKRSSCWGMKIGKT